MRKVQCNQCGSDCCEERRIEYLYKHAGNYLLVPNPPVEVCLHCGTIYYDAAVLKEIAALLCDSVQDRGAGSLY